MKQRVLVLNQFALPLSRGGGTRHVEIFGRLSDWDPLILAGNKHYFDQSPVASEPPLRSIPITRYSGNGITRIINWASFTVTSFVYGIGRRNVGLVYGSSPHMGSALSGLAIARIRRVPFVLEVRDLWPQILVEAGTVTETSTIFKSLKALERFLYRSADRIVILAEGSGVAIEGEGIDPRKIVFVPNGADPSDFEVAEPKAQLRAEYGFDGFTLVYAGAHGPANGLDLVLDAAVDLKASGTDATFVLFGDGVAKQALRSAIKDQEITNVDLRDPIPKSEIPRVFAAADAGLHCLADHELFKTGVSPNKLYDYMAAGLPALTNTGGDVAAMVDEAGAGLSVEPRGIAEGVRSLMAASAETRRSFTEAGKSWMTANRSRSAMASRLEAMFADILSG